MKKSLNLFGSKKPRRRQREDDFDSYDERYDEEYSEDYYEDGYDEDDYPDEEFEEEYGQEADDRYEDEEYPEDDRYEDDEYPEDDRYDEEEYPEEERYEDDRYEDEEYSDRDYEAEEDYDSDYEPRRGGNIVAFKEYYPERGGDDLYEDDPEYEDEYADGENPEEDRYEDEEYPEDEYPDEDYAEDEDYDYDYERSYDRNRKAAKKRGGRGKRGRDRDRESVGAKILAFIGNSSVAERAAAIVALLLVIGGITTMIFYSKAKDYAAEVGSFAEVGADFQIDGVVGSSGLLAIADAEMARAMAAGLVEEIEEEEEVVVDEAKGVTVKMTLTTIKSDMKIKFINSDTGKLVANVPFNVSVSTPDGTKVNYDDHDRDGIIYKNNLTAGKYTVTPVALSSEYEKYKLDTKSQSLTIKDTVEMKAVDVSNEIKKESQVNAAKEDTAVQEVVESVLQDTVEWVDSNQSNTSSDGNTYEEIDKSKLSGIVVGSVLNTGSVRRMAAARTDNPDDLNKDDNENQDDNKDDDKKDEEIKTLSVSPSSVTIDVGKSTSVSVSGPSSGIKCESNRDYIKAKVDGTSITIEGTSEGSGIVTVTAEGYSSAIIDVTVKKQEEEKPKEKIKFDPSSVTIEKGKSATVKAVGPSSVKCDSSNGSVATASASGNTITIEAKSEGSATIAVEADGYESASFEVKVTASAPKTMKLDNSSISIKKGAEGKVSVSGPSSIDSCKAADTSIAEAKVSGTTITVKGLAAGTTRFTVTARDYEDATFEVTVTSTDKKDMNVSPADKSFELKVGEEKSIKISDPTALKYASDNSKIVKVDNDGTTYKLKAVAAGTAKISFTADGYNDHVVTVTVGGGSELKLKASKVTLVPGKSYKIEASDSKLKLTFETGDKNIATVDKDGNVKGVKEGETKITVKCEGYKDATVTAKVISGSTTLKDKDGNELYVKEGNSYRKATYADYYNPDIKSLYLKKAGSGTRQGWWTIDGKTYYYKKDGNYVTGEQVIKGAKYVFNSDGSLSSSSGTMGIDVSKWNGNINWNQVKNAGVNYAIIRCGYRGSSAGALIEDPKFKANIQGAQAAGIKVGVYFFSQAVNEVEAVEEASMCINLCKGYNLSFPVYIDVEGSNGRGDQISASQRTANIKAFCGTIQNAGYRAGVYSNKTWFTKNINTSQLTSYKIWLAQYAASVTYTATRYDMWQYTSKGSISGISGNVDMNILYNN